MSGRVFDWESYLASESEVAEPPTLGDDMSAPFPYFGGKRRAAAIIWERLGDVVNYIEPFGGTFAVGLARPTWHRARVETCNDLDCLLTNVLRSVAFAPDDVAIGCDWPVTEVDLYARHQALVAARDELRTKLELNPRFCDPELAAWWIWGASTWIGQGWCRGDTVGWRQMPDVGGGTKDGEPRPIRRGIHRESMRAPARQLPDLGGSTKGEATFPNAGKGVHAGAMRVQRQMPEFIGGKGGNVAPKSGKGIHSSGGRTSLHDTFVRLADRLRYVRFPCGDWKRVMTPAVTWRHGLTGILLDPPYDDGAIDYAVGGRISSDVRAWCVEHWDNRLPNGEPAYRLALCGYEGEHDELDALGWECVAWKARGGYGNQRRDGVNENARRERIWFSPHCLRKAEQPRAEQLSLIGGG